ncbi:hypothetical protein K3T49_09420 [Paenibacillus sonchi]|nr:hypothetical protein [Paenibacillus sonchi]
MKGAGKLAEKVFAKDLAETIVVRETAATIGSKAAAGVGRTTGKEAASEASSGAKSFLSKPTAGDNVGSKLSSEGAGKVDDFAKEPFLPDEYYKNNYAPMQGTPGAKIDFSRLGSSGQVEKSRVIYDQAGKQKYRIDYTDHGNSAHHTNPHMHEYIYQDAGKSVKTEIKFFMDSTTGRLRQGVIDEATNSIKYID